MSTESRVLFPARRAERYSANACRISPEAVISPELRRRGLTLYDKITELQTRIKIINAGHCRETGSFLLFILFFGLFFFGLCRLRCLAGGLPVIVVCLMTAR